MTILTKRIIDVYVIRDEGNFNVCFYFGANNMEVITLADLEDRENFLRLITDILDTPSDDGVEYFSINGRKYEIGSFALHKLYLQIKSYRHYLADEVFITCITNEETKMAYAIHANEFGVTITNYSINSKEVVSEPFQFDNLDTYIDTYDAILEKILSGSAVGGGYKFTMEDGTEVEIDIIIVGMIIVYMTYRDDEGKLQTKTILEITKENLVKVLEDLKKVRAEIAREEKGPIMTIDERSPRNSKGYVDSLLIGIFEALRVDDTYLAENEDFLEYLEKQVKLSGKRLKIKFTK